MVRLSALIFLGLASPLLLVCSWFSTSTAEWLFVFLVMAFPGVLISLALARSHPESPGRDCMVPEAETSSFSQLSRKSRASAEVYLGTPHKEVRRLTKRFRNRAVSGRELARKGRLGPLMIPVVLTLVLEVCGVAMLMLRGRVLESVWFGAFPLPAAIQVYGLWLGLLLLVSLAYGLTFDRWELSDEDLGRYEARRAAVSWDDEG